jgi:hypothetical protein
MESMDKRNEQRFEQMDSEIINLKGLLFSQGYQNEEINNSIGG